MVHFTKSLEKAMVAIRLINHCSLAIITRFLLPSEDALQVLRKMPGFVDHEIPRDKIGNLLTFGYIRDEGITVASWIMRGFKVTVVFSSHYHELLVDVMRFFDSPEEIQTRTEKDLDAMKIILRVIQNKAELAESRIEVDDHAVNALISSLLNECEKRTSLSLHQTATFVHLPLSAVREGIRITPEIIVI